MPRLTQDVAEITSRLTRYSKEITEKTFKGRFAKWRHDTIFVALSELVKMIPLLDYMRGNLHRVFAKFQDAAMLRDVLSALRSQGL